MSANNLASQVLQSLDPEAAWITPLAKALEIALEHGQSAINLASLKCSIDQSHRLIAGEAAMFRCIGDSIAFAKHAAIETQIASLLQARAARVNPQSFSTTQSADPDQDAAIALSLRASLLLLSGGPGSGKTYTLSKIVAFLSEHNCLGRLALSAPTGKAAMCLSAALSSTEQTSSQTLHRLLGTRPYAKPKYHAQNQLRFDTVIIDEASMLGSQMLLDLLNALPTHCRLILCGDPDQLPPVSFGAPWRNILAADCFASHHVQLRQRHRFNADIAAAAAAINSGVTAMPQSDSVQLLPSIHGALAALIERWRTHCAAPQHAPSFKLLCPHRNGFLGSEYFNHSIHRSLSPSGGYIDGQPIIINRNAKSLGLFNGDTGFLRPLNGRWYMHFDDQHKKPLSVALLPDFENAYALSVHRSQGSQYQEVWINLEGADPKLLNRSMLYTAITRAQNRVCIFSDPKQLRTATSQQSDQHDMLAHLLARSPVTNSV